MSQEPTEKYSPLEDGHPLTDGAECWLCKEKFKAGDVITLIPLGPGKDEIARKRARAGRPYNAMAIPLHYSCATGVEV